MMAEAFEWVVVRPERVRETRAELTVLSHELLECVLNSALVLLLARGDRVQVLGVTGEALDLSALPFELVERLCSLFGPGARTVWCGRGRVRARWWGRRHHKSLWRMDL